MQKLAYFGFILLVAVMYYGLHEMLLIGAKLH